MRFVDYVSTLPPLAFVRNHPVTIAMVVLAVATTKGRLFLHVVLNFVVAVFVLASACFVEWTDGGSRKRRVAALAGAAVGLTCILRAATFVDDVLRILP